MDYKQQDKSQLREVLQILKKYNLKATEEMLIREAKIEDSVENQGSDSSDLNNVVLSGCISTKDTVKYEEHFGELKRFVEGSPDVNKYELRIILYPVLVHMYLKLFDIDKSEEAIKLLKKYGPEQPFYYQDDLGIIGSATKREHMAVNEVIKTFKNAKFSIRISRDTMSLLNRYLDYKRDSVLMTIVQEHLSFDTYEGVTRNKIQIDATSGATMGEASRHENTTKVYYGVPRDSYMQSSVTSAEDDKENAQVDGPGGPKVKKAKGSYDSYIPPVDRIPLPNLRENDKLKKLKAIKEATKRVNFTKKTKPSICCYTLLNPNHRVTCAEITEDSSMLAVGFSDSLVRVWSLVPQKLRKLKSASQLRNNNPCVEDVMATTIDENSGETSRTLFGHSATIYSVSFSPNHVSLLSCSGDGTIRLWSLQIWTCLVVYTGHRLPVWDVKFSALGYYFVTASFDKSGRLWATDHNQPLRVFAGHFASVDCIQFHPNLNYVATGSSDRRVCLWDCANGNAVRSMTGHKSQICALAFSSCGRFLSSAGTDYKILIWDLTHGHLVAAFNGHNKPIHALSFSRCGNVLVSGSLDCTIKFWDFNKLSKETSMQNVDISHNPEIKPNDGYLLNSYATKSSPILHLHFNRRNMLMAVTMFDPLLPP